MDQCRRRVQQHTCGHRGRNSDPRYLPGGPCTAVADLLTAKQQQRLENLSPTTRVEVQATWGIYQRMIAAYREPDGTRGGTCSG